MSSLTASALSFTGLVILALGAHWLVRGASRLATHFGVSPLLVGLTVVAYGTSSPEIVASVIAALGGHPEMTVGNVLGSNVANIGLVLGCIAIVAPMNVAASVLKRELPLLLGVTVPWVKAIGSSCQDAFRSSQPWTKNCTRARSGQSFGAPRIMITCFEAYQLSAGSSSTEAYRSPTTLA